ncbi:unnamed protein product [Callosobruchus maculatus]|uniref:Uncharacterized protein n=1 Tax=Callosobruchus maculatus TaxID=64391 RepID=A0A653DTM9_CALMS|nr:unnamed protein product [Callosobruchus maculatus]
MEIVAAFLMEFVKSCNATLRFVSHVVALDKLSAKRFQFALLVSHLLRDEKKCLSISVVMIIEKWSVKCRSSNVFHDNVPGNCGELRLKSIADVLANCTLKWVGFPVFSKTTFISCMSGSTVRPRVSSRRESHRGE